MACTSRRNWGGDQKKGPKWEKKEKVLPSLRWTGEGRNGTDGKEEQKRRGKAVHHNVGVTGGGRSFEKKGKEQEPGTATATSLSKLLGRK